MMQYACLECLHAYDSADDMVRCRINGLLTSPANAARCRRFVPEAIDETTPGIDGCDWMGRGD
jgi:hypothetical protein